MFREIKWKIYRVHLYVWFVWKENGGREHHYTMQMLTFCHFFFVLIDPPIYKRAKKCAFVSSMFQVLLLPMYNTVAIESSRWGVVRFCTLSFLKIKKNDPKMKRMSPLSKAVNPWSPGPVSLDEWINSVTSNSFLQFRYFKRTAQCQCRATKTNRHVGEWFRREV